MKRAGFWMAVIASVALMPIASQAGGGAGAATDAGVAAAAAAKTEAPAIIGYYCVYCQHQGRGPSHVFTPKEIDTSGAAAQLTAIYYAFEQVDGNRCQLFHPDIDLDEAFTADSSVDGSADTAGPGQLRGVFHQLQELKRKYPKLKIVMSLGGWGLSGGFPSAAEPQNMRSFVTSCVQMFVQGKFAPGVEAPGIFDGIDIDWEYPVGGGTVPGLPEDTKNLTAMAAEFRRQLDAVRPGLWLTAALPGTENHFKDFKLKELSHSMTFLAIMAYDMVSASDPVTGFASALFNDPANPSPRNNNGDYAVQAFLRAGVPPEKIVLGVPFGGGRHWVGVSDTNHGLYQTVTPPIAAAGANAGGAANAGRGGLQLDSLPADADRQYWSAAGTCSAWYASNFWSYDCAQAMSAKMAYVRKNNLRGVMFWELSHDPGGDLMRALVNGASAGEPRTSNP
jgi:chitinase